MSAIIENIDLQIHGKLSTQEVNMLHPLILAYIGDTIYDLFVRTFIIINKKGSVHKLNKLAIEYVKAGSQCCALHELDHLLTEEEQSIVRRGRNVKSGTTPKNADVVEYRWATGLEALIGYLYLTGENERLNFLMNRILRERGESKDEQGQC